MCSAMQCTLPGTVQRGFPMPIWVDGWCEDGWPFGFGSCRHSHATCTKRETVPRPHSTPDRVFTRCRRVNASKRPFRLCPSSFAAALALYPCTHFSRPLAFTAPTYYGTSFLPLHGLRAALRCRYMEFPSFHTSHAIFPILPWIGMVTVTVTVTASGGACLSGSMPLGGPSIAQN